MNELPEKIFIHEITYQSIATHLEGEATINEIVRRYNDHEELQKQLVGRETRIINLTEQLAAKDRAIERLVEAFKHCKSEIQGQLKVGNLSERDFGEKTYWIQLCNVIEQALATAKEGEK